MPPTPTDLVAQQNEYQNHLWSMCLWPSQWKSCKPPASLNWESVELNKTHQAKVPAAPGIYSLLVQPGIANHGDCSYLMYLGKASSLRTRFGNYLTSERTRRPKIVRLLHLYEGCIQFCYSRVSVTKLDAVEEQLYDAFIPPCNSQFSGELSKAKGAFK